MKNIALSMCISLFFSSCAEDEKGHGNDQDLSNKISDFSIAFYTTRQEDGTSFILFMDSSNRVLSAFINNQNFSLQPLGLEFQATIRRVNNNNIIEESVFFDSSLHRGAQLNVLVNNYRFKNDRNIQNWVSLTFGKDLREVEMTWKRNNDTVAQTTHLIRNPLFESKTSLLIQKFMDSVKHRFPGTPVAMMGVPYADKEIVSGIFCIGEGHHSSLTAFTVDADLNTIKRIKVTPEVRDSLDLLNQHYGYRLRSDNFYLTNDAIVFISSKQERQEDFYFHYGLQLAYLRATASQK